MKKPELLAPAGSMQALRAAIMAGCDAVYLGGKMFGARAFSNNFSDEELVSAIKYAHLYNVKVYVTTNTIIYDQEVETFLNYIEFLYQNNVDALIMQDIGMMDIVRKKYPDIEIHASTQMHIHNLDGSLLLQNLGIKRTVLARETPIEEIKRIKEKTNIDLEIFIHGALCVSYSGQCYMSTLAGNRSGNRGTCAQCCRENYTLFSKDDNLMTKISDGYLLSTKDLNTLENIPKLMDIGVDSLKIEGRMKREEYVYYVVSLYRKAIDSYYETGTINISEEEIKDLKKIFNRGFTKGFIFGEDNNNFTNSFRPNHMGIEIGSVSKVKGKWIDIKLSDDVSIKDGIRFIGEEDNGLNLNVFYINHNIVKEAHKGDTISLEVNNGKVVLGSKVLKTTDNKQIESIDSLIESNKRKVAVDMFVTIKKDKPLRIQLTCGDIQVEYESRYIPEVAIKAPTTRDRVEAQLSKLGGTIYKIASLNVNLDDNLFVDIKEINELRRIGLETLDIKCLERPKRVVKDYKIVVPDFNQTTLKSVLIRDKKQYNSVKDSFDTIYMDNTLYDEIDDSHKVLKLPRVIKEYPKFDNEIMVGELGGIKKYNSVTTDFSLNVTNSYSVAFLHSMGVKKVTLSYEMTYEQVHNLIEAYHTRYHKHPNLEVITFGYLECMITKYNLFKKYPKESLYLQDKFKNLYYLKDYQNYMIIYDNRIRNFKEDYYAIGVNSTRVELLKDSDYKVYSGND